MKVLNVLFSSVLGGMEQAFIDYTEALINEGNQVVCIVKTDTPFIKELENLGAKIYKVKNNFGYIDYPLIFKMRWIARMENVNVAIAHAGKAMSLTRRASKFLCPVVCVNHSSNIKRSIGSDAVFVINSQAKKEVIAKGQPKGKVFLMPNMIKIPKKLPITRPEPKTLVVGGLARFVRAKGIDKLIEAIYLLKKKNIDVKLVIGGTGQEEEYLKSLCKQYNLEKDVRFMGWVKQYLFFKSCDIFCLSSRFEPFGIVLLQAILYIKPIVTTDCEAVRDIFKDGETAIIVSKKNESKIAENIANGLEKVIKDKKLRHNLSINGHKLLLKNYSMKAVGKQLNNALKHVVKEYNKE